MRKKSEFENKLLQKSKELTQKLKDKAKDEEELQRQFGSVWSSWVAELTADTKPVKEINLKKDQLIILQELRFGPSLIDECKRSGRYKKISEVGDYSVYMMTSSNQLISFIQKHISSGFSQEEQQIRLLIVQAEKDSLDAIKSKPVAATGYTPTYLHEIANHMTENVQKFMSWRKYTLRKEFRVDLLLYVFCRAESWLLESHKKFKMSNDPITYLGSKKTQYYTVFRSFCKENSSVVVLGELVCEKLKASSIEAVYKKTAIDLAGRMRCNLPAFSGNRLNLEKHVLKSLAEKENFDDVILYITNPRRQTEAYIKAEVEKYIFRDHKDEAVNILKKNVDDIKTTEEIEKGFKSITEKMSSLSPYKLKESRQKPEEILIDQLCNCCW
ncbi:interferon-induced very large GTPase 1-like, partial [Pundamilia nyererei]|uniref:Interferon-induced very large GTPase 1-like n=1 Tax=Pundamilia nyererei TaxID=303518 RepID=A0A9Y3VZ63_9CICH